MPGPASSEEECLLNVKRILWGPSLELKLRDDFFQNLLLLFRIDTIHQISFRKEDTAPSSEERIEADFPLSEKIM